MDESQETLAREAARGALWVLLAAAAARLSSLAALAVLARLLTPADFGLVAFALVYVTYVETVGDLGSGMALIYWPTRREDAAQVTLILNLALGGAWFALTLALSPAVASFFGNPAGETVLNALAWSFPLKALGNTHDALCQKDMRFRARLVPEMGMALGKAVVSIALAWAGFGVWSLVWGQLAGLALWTALLWRVVPWRPAWRRSLDLLGPMLAYGRGIMAVNILAAVLHHADLVIVGRTLGATALGFYHVASKVPEMTITVVMWATSRALFPALARSGARGRDPGPVYLATLRYSSLLTVPAAVGLALLAEPLVLTLFGEQWRPSVPILRALAAYAGLRSLGTHAGDVLKAAGRQGLLAGLGLVKALVLVPVLVAVAPAGAAAVATSLAGVTALTLLVSLAAASRVGRIPARDLIEALRASLLGGVLLALALLGWTRWAGAPAGPAGLAAGVLVGLGSYLLALRALSPDVYEQGLRALWPRSRRGAVVGEVDRFLVPLGERRLVGYFRDDLFVPHELRQRLGRWLLGWGGGGVLFRSTGDGPALMRRVSAALEGDLLRGTVLEGRALRWIVLRDEPGRQRLVALLFADGEASPTAVLKLRGRGGEGTSLSQECEALRRTARLLPASFADTVPMPLAFRATGDREALLLTCLPGRSAYVEMQASWAPRRHVERHFQEAAAWLARFHAASRAARTFEPEREGAALDGADAAFRQTRWYEELCRSAARSPLPLAAGHGDFWARNLLLDRDGRPGVVDWEHFREEAPSFEDLFHFPLTYGLNYLWSGYRRRPPDEAFRLTFLEDNHLSRQVRRYFQRYSAEAGLDPAALGPLFHFYLCTRVPRRGRGEEGFWLRCRAMLAGADRSAFSG